MNPWVLAARPATLPAGVAAVVVGSALAGADGVFRWDAFLVTLFAALSIQIGVNYANDLADAQKGADTAARIGPTRAVAAGLLTPDQMKRGIVTMFGLAAVAALVHDVLIVLGMVALASNLSAGAIGAALGFVDFKINMPMVAAFLTIVGYSLNEHYPDDEAVSGRLDGWIGSIGTLRSHRKRGIASALIVESLYAFAEAGFNSSMLGVDTENPSGAYAIYERLGYSPLQRSVICRRTLREGA